MLGAFKVKVGDKILDYRQGKDLDLQKAQSFFSKNYQVKKLWQGGRHVLGILRRRDEEFLLRLATTEGISAVTKIEHDWNDRFNQLLPRANSSFWVPQNIESGLYNSLYYLITDKLDGEFLQKEPKPGQPLDIIKANLDEVIRFSQSIQNLPLKNFNHGPTFLDKTRAHLQAVPRDIKNKYGLRGLMSIVEQGAPTLKQKPRHGDFTPWHLAKLKTGQLALIDAEHATASGVENYDICYFIQRVFSVLEEPDLALEIFQKAISCHPERSEGSLLSKFKTVFAARAIGGFLDKSLNPNPNYQSAEKFKVWVLSIPS